MRSPLSYSLEAPSPSIGSPGQRKDIEGQIGHREAVADGHLIGLMELVQAAELLCRAGHRLHPPPHLVGSDDLDGRELGRYIITHQDLTLSFFGFSPTVLLIPYHQAHLPEGGTLSDHGGVSVAASAYVVFLKLAVLQESLDQLRGIGDGRRDRRRCLSVVGFGCKDIDLFFGGFLSFCRAMRIRVSLGVRRNSTRSLRVWQAKAERSADGYG